MIAAIELKSEDFDDPNFSPLFTRARKEFFLKPNETYMKELNQFLTPIRTRSFGDYLDKYYGGKKNNSFWREWTVERSFLAGALSYFLLRDVHNCLISFPSETSTPDAGSCSGSMPSTALRWEPRSSSTQERTWGWTWSMTSTSIRWRTTMNHGEMLSLPCFLLMTTRSQSDMPGDSGSPHIWAMLWKAPPSQDYQLYFRILWNQCSG